MLAQSNSRFCFKWLKILSVSNQASVFNPPFLQCASGCLHTPYFSWLFGKSCNLVESNSILSEIKNRKFCTGPVPLLCVGAKALVNVTITTDMVKCFAQATGDWNPIHFEAEKSSTTSEQYDWGVGNSDRMNRVPIVHGALLNGIVSGVIGTQLPGPGTVVVSQIYKFPASLPVGSQVAVEVEVMTLRRREVNVSYKIFSIPDETLVMDGTARLIVPRGRVRKIS